MYYYYDGTYPGFLTAVYEIYHYGTSKLEGIGPEGGEVRLFGADFIVKTNFLYAEKVAASFEKKCGKKGHPPGVPCFPFCKAGEGNEDFRVHAPRFQDRERICIPTGRSRGRGKSWKWEGK